MEGGLFNVRNLRVNTSEVYEVRTQKKKELVSHEKRESVPIDVY